MYFTALAPVSFSSYSFFILSSFILLFSYVGIGTFVSSLLLWERSKEQSLCFLKRLHGGLEKTKIVSTNTSRMGWNCSKVNAWEIWRQNFVLNGMAFLSNYVYRYKI